MSNTRTPIPRELRDAVLTRDDHTCRYCGRRPQHLSIDHVYPVARGGETTLDNLVAACDQCNSRKAAAVGRWPRPLDWQQREADLLARITELELQQAGTAFRQPDPAINLVFLRLPTNRGLYLFVSASESRPAHLMTWSCVPGAQVLVADGADGPLRELMTRHSNETLAAMLDGVHSQIVSAIRRHYDIVLSRRRRTSRAAQSESHPDSFEADQVAYTNPAKGD